ncbi:carboxypeptidase-like regulatory domain-containing protein, partial [Escherichia coli DSM 30083 = JCM 1649 = ATCC 11775]|nr:carboxypeptidase-like regulatory domain-containing protein [Escherichia coli DSM 30083 = JCM 1649 = ATCC 11775]
MRNPLRYSVLLIFLHLSAFAQMASPKLATLKGRIRDEKGLAVGYATVRLKGSEIATHSESDGSFELKSVPYGNQELLITSVEIKAKSHKLHVHKTFHELGLSVIKSAHDLNEVQIVQKTEKKEIETQGFAANVIETKTVA